jgi:hypothetical protein
VGLCEMKGFHTSSDRLLSQGFLWKDILITFKFHNKCLGLMFFDI